MKMESAMEIMKYKEAYGWKAYKKDFTRAFFPGKSKYMNHDAMVHINSSPKFGSTFHLKQMKQSYSGNKSFREAISIKRD